MDREGAKRCGAKSKSGQPCRGWAAPNGRCRFHGGHHVGPPLTAGGKYSKYLPIRLAARYQEAENDPELIDLRSKLAVWESRFCELLAELDANGAATAWARLRELWAKAAASGKGLSALTRPELMEFDALLSGPSSDPAKWEEIGAVTEQYRKLAETETKRLGQMQQFITAQQANVLVANLIRIVQEHVSDTKTRSRISVELARLVDAPNGRTPGLP